MFKICRFGVQSRIRIVPDFNPAADLCCISFSHSHQIKTENAENVLTNDVRSYITKKEDKTQKINVTLCMNNFPSPCHLPVSIADAQVGAQQAMFSDFITLGCT